MATLFFVFRFIMTHSDIGIPQFFVTASNNFQLSFVRPFACLMIGIQLARDGGKIDGGAPTIEVVQQTVLALSRVISSLGAVSGLCCKHVGCTRLSVFCLAGIVLHACCRL